MRDEARSEKVEEIQQDRDEDLEVEEIEIIE